MPESCGAYMDQKVSKFIDNLFKKVDHHLNTPSSVIRAQLDNFQKECEAHGIEIGDKTINQLKAELKAKKEAK